MPSSKPELNEVERAHETFVTGSLSDFFGQGGRTPFDCLIYLGHKESEESLSWSKMLHGPTDIFSVLQEADDTREKFVSLVTEFCNKLMESKEASTEASNLLTEKSELRDTELRWLDENKESISKLGGEWIAVEGTRLISHSPNFAEVLDATRKEGIKIPFILFVPQTSANPMIGL